MKTPNERKDYVNRYNQFIADGDAEGAKLLYSKLKTLGITDDEIMESDAPAVTRDPGRSKKKIVTSKISRLMERNKLAALEPDPLPLYYNLWNEGEIAICAGDTGVGKSILAVSILDELSKTRPVLYYDFELSAKQFEFRYKGAEFHENFLIADWEPDPDLPNVNFTIDTILADIDATGAGVVCIDNITALSMKSTADGDVAMDVMRGLKKLQRESGTSILVLAHTPKRSATEAININHLAGSKHLANFADSIFFINQSCLGDNVRYIKHVKTRTPKLCPVFGVTLEKDDTGMTRVLFDGYLPEVEHLTGNAIDDRVVSAGNLRDKEGKSQHEIAMLLKCSQPTVNRLLKKFDERSAAYSNDPPF